MQIIFTLKTFVNGGRTQLSHFSKLSQASETVHRNWLRKVSHSDTLSRLEVIAGMRYVPTVANLDHFP